MKNIYIKDKKYNAKNMQKTCMVFSLMAVFTLFSCFNSLANAGDIIFLSAPPNDNIVTSGDISENASPTASATYSIPEKSEYIPIGLEPDISIHPSIIIAAAWEANSDRFTDADTIAGAQFIPSGQYGVNKAISFCALIENADISTTVYSDIYYPQNIALGNSYQRLDGQSGLGCGQMVQKQELTRLDKEYGIDLFCIKIRDQNNNLTHFKNGYDYGSICRNDGILRRETANVYCGIRNISYGDPSGEYAVRIEAVQQGVKSDSLENSFEYYPITAFEADFDEIDYGKVKLNSRKDINGDKFFDPIDINRPTIRNVGNTRLIIKIIEDDLGLGKTYENWNVRFGAKVGKKADLTLFNPDFRTLIDDPLDLFETENMDLSVEILKFPELTQERHTGSMILSAEAMEHLTCR